MMRIAIKSARRKARPSTDNAVRTQAAVSIRTHAFTILYLSLMARATLLNDTAPFAAAAFAAGLFAGYSPISMLIGIALGCRYEVLGIEAVHPLLGALVIFGGYLVFRMFPIAKQTKSSQGDVRFGSEDAVAAALALVGGMLPGMILSHGIAYNFLMAGVAGIVAMACAPLMRSAMSVKPGRTILAPDEQMALALALLLALLGVKGIPVVGAYLPNFLAALIVLIASSISAGAGAMMGILTGTVLALMGNDPYIGASLGLCGVLAGLTGRLGRPLSALAFAAGNAATMIYGLGYTYGALHPAGVIAVGLIYCALPARWLLRIGEWAKGPTFGHDPERLTARVRANAEKRTRSLGAVFYELSVGYAREDANPQEEALLISQMRERLCEGCGGYEACWNGSDRKAGRMLCELLAAALKNEPIAEAEEVPPRLSGFCRRKGIIARRLSGMLTEFNEKRIASARRADYRSLVSAQFGQAARILDSLGDKLARPLRVADEKARVAAAALDREELAPEAVLALDGDGLEMVITLKERMWNAELAERAARIVSGELGLPMRAAFQTESLERELRLCESPKLSATIGVALKPAKKGAPCGDHYVAAGLTGGRVMLALSDGMGSGGAASRESEETLRLLRRFLSADVKQEQALDAVNALLMMMSAEDIYATVDLCVIDLMSGHAQLSKLSACATTIVRGGALTRIDGGRLPLGIIEKVKPLCATVRVHPGDLIIMATDGIADSAKEEEQAWLDKVIRKNRALAPQALCDAIMAAAEAREGGKADDRGVLAVRIDRA